MQAQNNTSHASLVAELKRNNTHTQRTQHAHHNTTEQTARATQRAEPRTQNAEHRTQNEQRTPRK